MKKFTNVLITNAVFLTGIDKAVSSFNSGVFDKLSFQIKPYYCPSEKWISTFQQEFRNPDSQFSITEKGVCYITFENITIKAVEVQNFANNLNAIIKKVNVQLGNEKIVESVPVNETGLVTNHDISTILDLIES
ncbi:hypothetical protein SJI19_06910 [Acerihabitans sp. TG2]|uniref:hypothetical protein n=1 Tax=Acerihabitans sp. TG2 TaxID=3096008 RepID=UPI002B22E071|nr:hypothetical protein [Acerihabitans sp. TG2]MEA9390278.1 hypothetical protein [Acerihabitans sp. TG2]